MNFFKHNIWVVTSQRLCMNSASYFLLLTTLLLSLNMVSRELLNSDALLTSTLSEQLASHQLEKALDLKRKLDWLSYFIIPATLFIKVSLIAAVLNIGVFFFSKEISFGKLFEIVVKAEFIFLLAIIFKTVKFYVFQTDYSLEDLQYYSPLSALCITGYHVEPWFIYPFQVLNLFELIFLILLSSPLARELGITVERGFMLVVGSYGAGKIIWVVIVMFLIINTT